MYAAVASSYHFRSSLSADHAAARARCQQTGALLSECHAETAGRWRLFARSCAALTTIGCRTREQPRSPNRLRSFIMASRQTRPAAYVCGAGVLLSLCAWVAAPAVAQSGACVLSLDKRNP